MSGVCRVCPFGSNIVPPRRLQRSGNRRLYWVDYKGRFYKVVFSPGFSFKGPPHYTYARQSLGCLLLV